MILLGVLIGLVAGIICTWLALRKRLVENGSRADQVHHLELDLSVSTTQLQNSKDEFQRRSDTLLQEIRVKDGQLKDAENRIVDLTSKLAVRERELELANVGLGEQKEEMNRLSQLLERDFENLANRIFDEKKTSFLVESQTKIDAILRPLSERIISFQNRVNEVYENEARDRASLKEQVIQLHDLNQQMSTDAQNLTKALKGDSKKQGTWGEFILESILEKSGLVRDDNYVVQTGVRTGDGNLLRPDVMVRLPDNKCLIIDAKVSLKAWDEYCAADLDEVATIAMNDHLASIRRHIKELSARSYQQLDGQDTLDFVLMFIPIFLPSIML